MSKFLVMILMAALALTGCQTTGQKEGAGAILGAAGGGLLGSRFGRGDGQLAMTALGAVGGMLLGGSVGRSMDDVDRLKQQRAASVAFERLPSGTPSQWSNPDSGNSGVVTPVRTYQKSDGGYCREFTQTIKVGGKTEQGYGTACRQPDGSWKVVQQ